MNRYRAGGATAILVLVVFAVPVRAVDVSGFVKNFFIVEQVPQYRSIPGATEPAPGGVTAVADNLRVRVDVSADPASWLGAALSYNFVPRVQDDNFAAANTILAGASRSAYRVADLDAVLLPGTPGPDDNFVVLQNLDRAYLSFAAPAFDVLVGRQAVAWGSARSVNPTDVIAPFLFTEIDTENRIGVDALRLRVPTGALGEIDAGYVAGRDFEDANSAYFVRCRFYAVESDVTLMAARFRRNLLAGVDVTHAIGGAGVWLEGAYVWNDDDVRAESPVSGTRFDLARYARVSTGADYSLGDGTYLFLEYHYNGAGAADATDYRYLAGTPAYTAGAVYLLGRHYVIPGVTWPATPLWSVTGSVLWNLSDGSALIAPVVEYNARENLYLSAGAFVGIGPVPAWDPVPGSQPVVGSGLILDPVSTIFSSEFGAYPDTYYASIRYYY